MTASSAGLVTCSCSFAWVLNKMASHCLVLVTAIGVVNVEGFRGQVHAMCVREELRDPECMPGKLWWNRAVCKKVFDSSLRH